MSTDDVVPGSDEDLARIHACWREELEDWRDRTGVTGDLELREQRLGRLLSLAVLVDGEQTDLHPPAGPMAGLARWWQARTGDVPYEIHQRLPADGDLPLPHLVVCDRPPTDPKLRTVSCAFTELRVRPRPPERVPGWIKVELALVGAWDLRADRLTANRRGEPTGEPQTPASVGVEPPSGAEHAWSPGWVDPVPPPRDRPRGEPDRETWPSGAPPLPAWVVALPLARWQALATSGVCGLLPPVTEPSQPVPGPVPGPDPEADRAGLPEALREVAATFGGFFVGAWEVRFHTAMSVRVDQLGDRLTYVPLDDSTDPLVLRLDPVTGALRDVVLVHRSAEEPTVVAPDLPAFLEGLTGLAERRLPALVRTVRDQVVAADPGGVLDPERDAPVLAEQVADAFAGAVREAAHAAAWPRPHGPDAWPELQRRVEDLLLRWLSTLDVDAPRTVTLRALPDGSASLEVAGGRGLRRWRRSDVKPPSQGFAVVAHQQLATMQGRPWTELVVVTEADGSTRLEPRHT